MVVNKRKGIKRRDMNTRGPWRIVAEPVQRHCYLCCVVTELHGTWSSCVHKKVLTKKFSHCPSAVCLYSASKCSPQRRAHTPRVSSLPARCKVWCLSQSSICTLSQQLTRVWPLFMLRTRTLHLTGNFFHARQGRCHDTATIRSIGSFGPEKQHGKEPTCPASLTCSQLHLPPGLV